MEHVNIARSDDGARFDVGDQCISRARAVRRPPWNSIETASEQFAAIRNGDLLVHHPYDSFASSFESFIDRAASDPNVIAIKSTVYRTSDDTPLVPALIENSERGKQSVCLVDGAVGPRRGGPAPTDPHALVYSRYSL